MADECIRCEARINGICNDAESPFFEKFVGIEQACDCFDPKSRGKVCDYCGNYHNDYSATVADFPRGMIVFDMTCNYCGGNNGSWIVNTTFGGAKRIG